MDTSTLPILSDDKYEVKEKLGEGGMGEVYLAYDRDLRRQVAIKRIRHALLEDGNVRKLFKREAIAAAQLEHPAIARIYDYLDQDEAKPAAIVMELLEGGTLSDEIAKGPLDPARALPLFLDVTDGLAHAHANKIVHRDLKPGNIWITPEEKGCRARAKILDFGFAKQLESNDSSILQGTIAGTPCYMSPEQVQGKMLDHRSDLFSLGVVLYQTLTGELPFQGSTREETFGSICTKQQPPATERNARVPPNISELIDRLLAKDPVDRPETADDVARVLAAALGQPRPYRWRRSPAVMVAIVLALAAVLVFFVLLPHERPPTSVAVLGVAGNGDETAWAATAVVEILNEHLSAGGELRTVDGPRTALVRPPAGELFGDEELRRVREQLRVDYLVLGETAPEEGGLRVRLRLYDAESGKVVDEIAVEGPADELPDALAGAVARLRRELDADPLDPWELHAARAAFPTGAAGRYYAAGLAALRAYDPRTARDWLEEAVEAAPEHPSPRAKLVAVHVQLGHLDEAADAAVAARDRAAALSARRRLKIEALVAATAADLEKADLEKAVRFYRVRWRERPYDLAAGLDLAETLLMRGQSAEALELVRELDPASLTLVDDGFIELVRARAAFQLGEFSRALEAATRAAEVGDACGARLLAAEARLVESMVLDLTGKPKAAKAAFEEAEDGFVRADSRAGLITAWSQMIQILARQGRVEQARARFAEHRELYREGGDRYNEARMASNLAHTLTAQGELAAAAELYEGALPLFVELQRPVEVAMVAVNLGAVEQIRGRLAVAGEHYEQARAVFEELGDEVSLACVLTNLGELRFEGGELGGALALHEQALKINRRLGADDGAAYDTFRIAEVLRHQGDPDRAHARYEEALEVQERLGARGESGRTRIGMALVEIARDNFGDAVTLAREASQALRDEGMIDLAVLAGIVEARALLARPRPDLAGARDILTAARLHSRGSADRRVGFATRLLAARLRIAAESADLESVRRDLEQLAAEASADGFVLVAAEAQGLRKGIWKGGDRK